MTHRQIMEELKNLPTVERLRIVEEVLHLIEKDITNPHEFQISSGLKKQLATAANSLVQDYSNDNELTSFTSLDSDEIRA
ncbi:MAG: hypothetical protein QME58_04075 [Bacteroidota bacterium]|nr:hypothetical protein [Bacteroidota bacterium]